jgi:hypothetical protein
VRVSHHGKGVSKMAKAKTTKQAKAETVTIGGKKLNVKENNSSMKEAQKETKIEAQINDDALLAGHNVLVGVVAEHGTILAEIQRSLELLLKSQAQTPKLVGTIAQEPVEPKAKVERKPTSSKAKAKLAEAEKKAKKAEKKASKKAKAEPQAKAEVEPGTITICKTKAEARRLREERPKAGNSTKYACIGAEDKPCNGFGTNDAFAKKHLERGHNIIQLYANA